MQRHWRHCFDLKIFVQLLRQWSHFLFKFNCAFLKPSCPTWKYFEQRDRWKRWRRDLIFEMKSTLAGRFVTWPQLWCYRLTFLGKNGAKAIRCRSIWWKNNRIGLSYANCQVASSVALACTRCLSSARSTCKWSEFRSFETHDRHQKKKKVIGWSFGHHFHIQREWQVQAFNQKFPWRNGIVLNKFEFELDEERSVKFTSFRFWTFGGFYFTKCVVSWRHKLAAKFVFCLSLSSRWGKGSKLITGYARRLTPI